MNTERYHLQEFPRERDLIDDYSSPNVSPFPVRKWNEPLPIGVEGTPVPTAPLAPTSEDGKTLTRFYPPLLLFSTLLTSAFFFLYLTKPVVIESGQEAGGGAENSKSQGASMEIVPPSVEELVPWPVKDELLKPITAQRPLAAASVFPDSLPSSQPSPPKASQVEPAREIVVIPFFEPEADVSFTSEAEVEADLIREAVAANREAAEELRARSAQLAIQWDSLVENAQIQAQLNSNPLPEE